MEIVLLLIIICMSLCEFMGQTCLKYFNVNQNQPHYYVLAILFYAVICYLLFKSYKYKGMGIINIIWSGLSILLVMTGSILFFGEKITTMDKIGVVLIIAGMIFIMYEGSHVPDK